MKKKKKVYLSLPISGYDLTERIQTALKVELSLHEKGYDVFNPLDNGLARDASTHEHMKADIKAMLDCDIVLFMSGFNRSAGCHTELTVAMATGMEIWFQDIEILKT